MGTTISVNKQTVEQLLSGGKKKPFVIPEYQRPYAWTEDEIQTLFEDLWEFTSTNGGTQNNGTYFLGSIVSYENDNGEQEIIDGQQRITSLFLLLRAIYTKLQEADNQSLAAKNFISKIEQVIWESDKLTGQVNYSKILLSSRVVNNKGNAILKEILETGKTNPQNHDNYSENYRKFVSLYEKHAVNNPLMIYEFIYALLDQAILLPISADTQDTALTIFSTLNNRGLPLSDADIFKAKIYNNKPANEKSNFIDEWKDLEQTAEEADESIQQLFYYYMFYLRAVDKDKKSTTPGLRKYYSHNKFEKLLKPEILRDLEVILKLWRVINKHEEFSDEAWSTDKKILQAFDCLKSYPNEFWKYPVVIYYLCHREDKNFSEMFLKFLRKLFVKLLTVYLISPTLNSVKSDILKLNCDIITSSKPVFEFKNVDNNQVYLAIKNPHRNAVRMILKALAYESQSDLLPDNWEIEHILPQKWQNNYFINVDDRIIKEKLEHIGNKLPFEKKLNITAGNGYFGKKKTFYKESTIEVTKQFAQINLDNWGPDNIIERDVRVADTIRDLLNNWDNTY